MKPNDAESSPLADDKDGRIAALDGLRGVAIIFVLFSHLIPDQIVWPSLPLEWVRKTLQGGWVGVDLFFVLSGFLITGILIRAKGSEHYFRNFYVRRVLRIFPLYYGVLALIFLILPALGVLDEATFAPVRGEQHWLWLHSNNFGMYFAGREAFQSPQVGLQHFWSLSVEEHFYLLWPALVHFTGQRGLRVACVACIVGALALRVVAVQVLHEAPYFFILTPCRSDALAIGALLASIAHERSLDGWSRAAGAVLVASLVVLLGFMYVEKGLWPSHPFMQTVGLSIVGLASGAALVLALNISSIGLPARLLGRGLLPFFGKYSYGMYVIHGIILPGLLLAWPLEDMTGALGSPYLVSAVAFLFHAGTTVVLAVLCWHLFERRFLELKKSFAPHAPRAAE